MLFNKREKKVHKEPTNPDGLTRDQFLKKYADLRHIAVLCWYFGIKPEELKEDLKTLMDKH